MHSLTNCSKYQCFLLVLYFIYWKCGTTAFGITNLEQYVDTLNNI